MIIKVKFIPGPYKWFLFDVANKTVLDNIPDCGNLEKLVERPLEQDKTYVFDFQAKFLRIE